MFKTNISHPPPMGALRWLFTRVGVIYIIAFVFYLTCVDFKTLEMRTKIRHLNDSIPNFADLIIFSQNPDAIKDINWKPFKSYFDLILRYMPDDLTTMQLLGFVDYYSGQEQKATELFKNSSSFNGHALFWSSYNLGVLYYKKGMWAQAAAYLLQAIGANPKLAVILMQDSVVYRQIFANPFFKYSLSDEIMDAQTEAYILLLSSLQHLGQYDKMVLISHLALANPDLAQKDAFYYYEGVALYNMGQMDKAFLSFEKSLSLEKQNPDVYLYIASIFKRAGQLQQAQAFLQASYALHLKNDGRFPYETGIRLRFF